MGNTCDERRGYPTQKPLTLLERIVESSTNPGDVVLDPFCGCGTSIVAAERLGRRWIGIDITYLAINEVVHRLKTEGASDREPDYALVGTPTDGDAAAALFEGSKAQNHKPFEQFCVTLAGGEYRDRHGADGGIDGLIYLTDEGGRLRKAVIQVKGGGGLTLSNLTDFARVIERENAVMGLLVSMKEPTRDMLVECEKMGSADWPSRHQYPRLQIRTVKELLEDARRPFDVPDSYRIIPQKGVGQIDRDTQTDLGL